MPLPVIAQLAIGIVGQVIGYMLRPRGPQPEPPSQDSLPEPQVEAGKPIGKSWGSVLIEDPNTLWFGDSRIREREVITDKK